MSHLTDNRIDTAALLARMPLFQALTQDRVSKLAEHARGRRLPKGEMLFQKGDTAHGFYLVVYGQVKLAFPSSNGNEKVVEIIGTQQSFGEAVMLAQRPYPVFAQAIEDSLLVHVARDAVFDLLETDTTFARRMLVGLAMNNHSLVHDIESYTLRSSTQRVIGYLLEHCPSGSNCESCVDIILPTSKQITASRLNLTPETLSRILHDLAEAGLIEMQGKRISISNLRRLRATLAEVPRDIIPLTRSSLAQLNAA
jgi:CRP/FNR family transcriptional regulator, dissimilatory nitrate respiration regulator